ncbi:MAG: hypothetical protein ACRENG_06520 [bacterium]
MIRLIPFAFILFKIWMVVEAVKKNAPLHWYLIIILLPFGELVYFFMEKLPDLTSNQPREGKKASATSNSNGTPEI